LMIANLSGVRWILVESLLVFPLPLRILNIASWFISHLYFFFWELSVHFICSFIKWIICSYAV
jgi:hypothetical protein